MSDKDSRIWAQEEKRKEERWQIVNAELQTAGGSMFRSELEKRLEGYPQIKSIGHFLGQLTRFGRLVVTGEDDLSIISLPGHVDHPAPSTQHPAPSTQHPAPSTQHPAPSTQHIDTSQVFQKLELFVSRLVSISKVNVGDQKEITLSLSPIVVHNVGIIKQKFGDLKVNIPLAGGLRIRIAEEIEPELSLGSRAINKPVKVSLLPKTGGQLLINGFESWDSFDIDVPEDFWIVLEPDDSCDQVIVSGHAVVIPVCMMYLSQDERFAEENSMPVPLLWDSDIIIGGDQGEPINSPFVGLVVTENHLPPEFNREVTALKAPLARSSEAGNYAAILAFRNPGAVWKASK